MEKWETTIVWITLGMVAVLVGLYTARYRKSRSTDDVIIVIGHVLVAVLLVTQLVMRYSN